MGKTHSSTLTEMLDTGAITSAICSMISEIYPPPLQRTIGGLLRSDPRFTKAVRSLLDTQPKFSMQLMETPVPSDFWERSCDNKHLVIDRCWILVPRVGFHGMHGIWHKCKDDTPDGGETSAGYNGKGDLIEPVRCAGCATLVPKKVIATWILMSHGKE